MKTINYIIVNYIKYATLLILTYIILGYLLVNWDVPYNGYMGKGINIKLTYSNIVEVLLYINIVSILLIFVKNRVKAYFLIILVLLTILPMFVMYSVTDEFSKYNTFINYIFMSFVIIYLTSNFSLKKHKISSKYKLKNTKLLIVLSLLLILIVILRYVLVNGLSLINFNILKVYESRLILRNTMLGLMNYLDGWVSTLIVPFCLICSLYKKQQFLSFFFIVIQILLFGLFSHKIILFSIFIVIINFYLVKFVQKKSLNLSYCVIYLFLIGNLVCYLLYIYVSYYNEVFINDIVVWLYHRILYTPSQINFYYYDYYSVNGFENFAHSFMRHFITPSNQMEPAFLIGKYYYNNPITSCNAGFLGSGYMQGGFIVLLAYSIIIGLIINLLGKLKSVPSEVLIAFITLPILRLFVSSDLPTTLLTGGLALCLFLLYFTTIKVFKIKFNKPY